MLAAPEMDKNSLEELRTDMHKAFSTRLPVKKSKIPLIQIIKTKLKSFRIKHCKCCYDKTSLKVANVKRKYSKLATNHIQENLRKDLDMHSICKKLRLHSLQLRSLLTKT